MTSTPVRLARYKRTMSTPFAYYEMNQPLDPIPTWLQPFIIQIGDSEIELKNRYQIIQTATLDYIVIQSHRGYEIMKKSTFNFQCERVDGTESLQSTHSSDSIVEDSSGIVGPVRTSGGIVNQQSISKNLNRSSDRGETQIDFMKSALEKAGYTVTRINPNNGPFVDLSKISNDRVIIAATLRAIPLVRIIEYVQSSGYVVQETQDYEAMKNDLYHRGWNEALDYAVSLVQCQLIDRVKEMKIDSIREEKVDSERNDVGGPGCDEH